MNTKHLQNDICLYCITNRLTLSESYTRPPEINYKTVKNFLQEQTERVKTTDDIYHDKCGRNLLGCCSYNTEHIVFKGCPEYK